ncbi:DUF1173 family protein [Comamonas sp. w2-DMI]|uniref:DUF1173 family protein n=1 Tax=Comamonas sp. w2-DMI TaxID=3126391 RepID=UPI0032E49054
MSYIVALDGAFVEAALAQRQPQLYQSEMLQAKRKKNARCLCDGAKQLQLVVRKLSGGYILAAWPGTAALHVSGCPFGGTYKATYAPRDDTDSKQDEHHHLMYRNGWRSDEWLHQAISDVSQTHVDLNWLLSEIWQSALLSSWKPGWGRDWSFVRHRLLKAAKNMVVNRVAVARHLFVPDTFSQARKAELNNAWKDFIMPLLQNPFSYSPDDSQSPYATSLVIGELASVAWTSGTWVLRVRNHFEEFGLVPEAAEAIDPRLTSKLQQLSFGSQYRPVVALCVAIDHLGLVHVLDMALLEVSSRWLPASLPIERELVESLVQSGHELHVTKDHKWGSGVPYLICKLPHNSEWIRVFTYSDAMGAQKLQQYRTKIHAQSVKMRRMTKFVGHADAINNLLCGNEIH